METKKSWKTNIVGAVLVVAGVASVFLNKSSWTEAIIVITTGVGFLLAKDNNK